MLELTRVAVETWIKTIATGEFHYTKVLDGNVKKESYAKLRKVMFDIVHAKEPCCEPVGKRDGVYRPIQNDAVPLNWQDLEGRKDSGLVLPFNLRKYVFVYPDTLGVVAGSKSSGKTGFLYRTIVMNMAIMKVYLLTNLEGGIMALRDRFFAMSGVEIPIPAPFETKFVTGNFHDYIKESNSLYVIDYIDAPEGTEFYLIGGLVQKISNKLQGKNSVAVVGLQKPSGRDTAYGGETTLKAATFYLALDRNKLKIVDAKVFANEKVNPRNMQWTFRYDEAGTNFIDIKPSIDNPVEPEEQEGMSF